MVRQRDELVPVSPKPWPICPAPVQAIRDDFAPGAALLPQLPIK